MIMRICSIFPPYRSIVDMIIMVRMVSNMPPSTINSITDSIVHIIRRHLSSAESPFLAAALPTDAAAMRLMTNCIADCPNCNVRLVVNITFDALETHTQGTKATEQKSPPHGRRPQTPPLSPAPLNTHGVQHLLHVSDMPLHASACPTENRS